MFQSRILYPLCRAPAWYPHTGVMVHIFVHIYAHFMKLKELMLLILFQHESLVASVPSKTSFDMNGKNIMPIEGSMLQRSF